MKFKQIVIIIAFISLGILIMFSLKQLQTSALLTKEQMINQVETIYKGSVLSFIEKENYYLASFERNGSTYEVKIDPHNGELSNMQVIFIADKPNDKGTSDNLSEHDNQPNPVVTTKPADAANTNTKPSNNTQNEIPPKPTKPLLSAAQAKEIALKEVKGEVESVDYKETSDGGHYFIEIELEDDDMDEAHVQVHAVTGKILSVQFED